MADNSNLNNTLRANHLQAQTGLMIVPSAENPRSVSLVRASTGETVVPFSQYNDINHLAAVMTANGANAGSNTVAQGQTPNTIINAGAGVLSVNGGNVADGMQFTYAFPKCSKQKLLVIGDLTGNLLNAKVYSDAEVQLESNEGFTDQQNTSFAPNESMGTFFTGMGAFSGKPNLLAFFDLKGFAIKEISAQITDGNTTCTVLNSVKYYRMQKNQSFASTPEFVQNTFTLTAGTFSKNVQKGEFIGNGAQIGNSNAIVVILPVIDGPFQITITIYPTNDWVSGRM